MRSIRSLVLAVVIGCLGVLGPAASVSADSMLFWECSTVPWQGSILPSLPPTMASDRSYGTVKHCMKVYKLTDGMANYNVYSIRMEDTWNVTNDGGYSKNHAYGNISITPSAVEYESSPSVLSDHNCFDDLTIGISWEIFELSLTPEICFDTWIKRTYQSAGITHWDTTNVLKAHQWDQGYLVKVSASSHITFRAVMNYPWYGITYDYNCFCWKNSEVQRQVSKSFGVQ